MRPSTLAASAILAVLLFLSGGCGAETWRGRAIEEDFVWQQVPEFRFWLVVCFWLVVAFFSARSCWYDADLQAGLLCLVAFSLVVANGLQLTGLERVTLTEQFVSASPPGRPVGWTEVRACRYRCEVSEVRRSRRMVGTGGFARTVTEELVEVEGPTGSLEIPLSRIDPGFGWTGFLQPIADLLFIDRSFSASETSRDELRRELAERLPDGAPRDELLATPWSCPTARRLERLQLTIRIGFWLVAGLLVAKWRRED